MSDPSSRRQKKIDEPLDEAVKRSTLRLSTAVFLILGAVGPIATGLTAFFIWEKDVVKAKDLAALTASVETEMATATAKLEQLSAVQRSHEDVLIYLYGQATGQPLRLQRPSSQP